MPIYMWTFLWLCGFLVGCSRELPVVNEGTGGSAGAPATGASATSAMSPKAKASVTPFHGSTIQGELKFSHFEDSLSTTMDLKGCTDDDAEYSADIGEGKSCASEAEIGGALNGGIGVSAGCNNGGAWHSELTSSLLTSLSIGGGKGADIVGHVAIVRAGATRQFADWHHCSIAPHTS